MNNVSVALFQFFYSLCCIKWNYIASFFAVVQPASGWQMLFKNVSPVTAAILSFLDDTEVILCPLPVAPMSLVSCNSFFYSGWAIFPLFIYFCYGWQRRQHLSLALILSFLGQAKGFQIMFSFNLIWQNLTLLIFNCLFHFIDFFFM